MKNILTRATIVLIATSLIAGPAFAFVPKGGMARHALHGQGHMAQSMGNHKPFNRTQQAVGGRFSRSSAAPFQAPVHAVNPNIQSFSQNNTAIHHYAPQTMGVNQGPAFVNNNVNYHSTTTIRRTTTVNRVNPVLGPRATQPIEVNHFGSPVIVRHGGSPIIVNHNSPVIINNHPTWGYRYNPVVVAPYPYHWNSYYYGGYYNNVNTFLAVALGVSLFANVVQATNNHNTTTVVYPAYYYPYSASSMSVYAPIPYAPTTFVPYAAPVPTPSSGNSGTSTKSSQPVNVTINNTVNTTTATPAETTTTTTDGNPSSSVAGVSSS